MTNRWTKILSTALALLMLIGLLPMSTIADAVKDERQDVFIPEIELGEDVLMHDVFYLTAPAAEIEENANAIYLLRIGRGGNAESESTALVRISDMTAKYGEDYIVRVRGTEEEVVNPDYNMSLAEMMEDSEYGQMPLEDYETAIEEIMNDPEALEAYQEGVNEALEFLEEQSGLDEKYDGENPYAEAVEELYGENAEEPAEEPAEELAEEPAEEPAAEPAEEPAEEPAIEPDPNVVVTDGSETVTIGEPDDGLDPVQRASNLFTGEDAISQRLTSSTDLFQDLQKVANVLTDAVVGAYVEITFAPGETSKYIEIIPLNNDKSDGDRMFYLMLGAPSGTTTNSAASACAFTILDDEEPEECVLSFSQVEYVHTPGEDSVVITVERTGAINSVVGGTVKTTGEGNAVMGRDYSEVDQTLIFPFGIPTLTVTIPVRTEYFKGDASFGLSLEADAGCTIGIDHATVTMKGTYGEKKAEDAFTTDPGSVSDKRTVSDTKGSTGAVRRELSRPELGSEVRIDAPYYHGHEDNQFGGNDKYDSKKQAWDLMWTDQHWYRDRKGLVGVIYQIGSKNSPYAIAGAQVTWARTGDHAYMKVAFEGGDEPSNWLKEMTRSSKNSAKELSYDSKASFGEKTLNMFPSKYLIDLAPNGVRPQWIGFYNHGHCDNCDHLYIYRVQPIKRMFQFNLKQADGLLFLQENGARNSDAGVATKSSIVDGGKDVLIIADDSITVQDVSDSNVTQFAYMKELNWVRENGTTIYQLGSNSSASNHSITFKLTNEKMNEMFGGGRDQYFRDSIVENTGLANTVGYANYSKLYMKPTFDYIDSKIVLRNPYSYDVKFTISTMEYTVPAGQTVEIKAGDVSFHKGDTLALTSIEILDPDANNFNKVVGANQYYKVSGAEADYEPDPRVFWDDQPIYIAGEPNTKRLCAVEVVVEPNIQKKDNKITVRVKTSDLAKFDTTSLSAGLLKLAGDTHVEVGYTYYTFASEDKTVAGKLYPITVNPQKGWVAVWTDRNVARTYTQNTLYFKPGALPDRNIIDLTAAPQQGSVTLTGTFRYMDYNLRDKDAGSMSNRPAVGTVITAGSAGGTSNDSGIVTAGPVPGTGEANRYLRYLVSVNGTAMLYEIPMPEGGGDATIDISANFRNGVSPVTANIFKGIQITGVMSDPAYEIADGKFIPILPMGKNAQMTIEISPRPYAVSLTTPMGVLETRKVEAPLGIQLVVYDANDVYKGEYELVKPDEYDASRGVYIFRSTVEFEIAAPIEIDPDAPEPDPDEPEPETEGGFSVDPGDKLYIRVITNRMSAADALLTDLKEAVELLPEPETVTSNEATVIVTTGANGSIVDPNTREAEESQPELTVEVTADPTEGLSVGDVITYTIRITNTGGVRLGNIKVNQSLTDLEQVTSPNMSVLDLDESVTVKYWYYVTQADVNAGSVTNKITAIGEIDPVIGNFADSYQYSDVYTGINFYNPLAMEIPPKQTFTSPVTITYPELPLIGSTGMALPFPFVTVGCMRIPQGYRLYFGVSVVQIYDTVKETHYSSFHSDQPGQDGSDDYWKSTFSMANPFGTFWAGLKKSWNQVGTLHEKAKFAKELGRKLSLASFGSPQWRFDVMIGAYFNFHYFTIYANSIEKTVLKFSGMGAYFCVNGGFKVAFYTIIPVVFIPAYFGIEIEAYLMAFIGGGCDLETSVTMDEAQQSQVDYANSGTRFDGGVRLQGYIQFSLGVGLCDVIGIRLVARANALGAWEPNNKYGAFGLYLSVSAGIIVDLFLFSVPVVVELAGKPFGFFKHYADNPEEVVGNQEPGMRKSTSSQGFRLREGSGTDSTWVGGKNATRYAFAPGSTQILAENAYERADSQLITLDDGTVVLAFIDSDNAKGEYQRTTLKLATYKNGVWSNPVPVSVDDTADFQPSIAETKDGNVLVAWVSTGSNDIDENTEVTDYLNSMEVYAALATIGEDGSITMDEPVKITNDHRIKDGVEKGYYDCMPTVVCDKISGDAIVYYVKSGNTTTDGATLANPYVNDCRVFYMIYNAEEDVDTDGRVVPEGWLFNNFYFAEFHGNTANEQYMIKNFGGQRSLAGPTYTDGNGSTVAYAIPDFTAIGYNGLAVYAYTVDTDGSNDTYEDKELYLQVYNFEQHETKYRIRITDDNVADTLPQFFRSRDAQLSTEEEATHTKLFWYRDNKGVVYIDVTQLMQQGINPDGTLKIKGDGGDSTYADPIETGLRPKDSNESRQSADYRVVEDANGSLFILWTDTVVDGDPADENAAVSQEIFATSLISSGRVLTDEEADAPDADLGSTGWSKPYQLTRDGYFNDELAVTMTGENLMVVHNRFRQELVIPETDTPAEDGINYNGEVDFDPLVITEMTLAATVMEPCGAVEPEEIEIRQPNEDGEASALTLDHPIGGEDTVITVKASNNGLTTAPGYMLTLYAVDKNGTETQIGTIESTDALRPNNARIHEFAYTMPDSVEGMTFKAVTKELKEEGVYFTNTAEYVSEPLLSDPDYRIENIVTYQTNDGFRASFEITNTGNAPSGEDDMLTIDWKGPENLIMDVDKDALTLVHVPFETPIQPGETREMDIAVPVTIEMVQRYGVIDASFAVTREYVETYNDIDYTGRQFIGDIAYDCFVQTQPMNMTLEDVAVREDETADIVFAMDLGNKFGNSAEVAYAVEDLEIAQISDGKVLGVSEGTTTLYATHVATGTTVQATITVTPKPQPEAPTAVTFAGEDVVGNDEYEIIDGEILYRYDVHVEDLPEGGSYVSSAQIFLAYDPAVLALRKTEGAFDWTVNDKNGTISAVWASDTEQLVQNGEEVLTLWFAKIGDAEKTDVAFTENTLGTGSSIGFAANGSVVELEAGTADGSITFDAILYGDANCDGMITAADAALVLRSIVGLSALTKRGALNAEVDGDGSVTAADAAAILRYVVGLIRELPVRN